MKPLFPDSGPQAFQDYDPWKEGIEQGELLIRSAEWGPQAEHRLAEMRRQRLRQPEAVRQKRKLRRKKPLQNAQVLPWAFAVYWDTHVQGKLHKVWQKAAGSYVLHGSQSSHSFLISRFPNSALFSLQFTHLPSQSHSCPWLQPYVSFRNRYLKHDH